MTRRRMFGAAFAAALISITLTSTSEALAIQGGDDSDTAKDPAAAVFSGLKPREIGPAIISGRVTDFAVVPGAPHKYFAATASGGLWKTENNGTSWKPVFDKYGSYSIGVVMLDPNDPNIVWVGSGEYNSQRSVAFGDGVYKSIDGGNSFKNVGLKDSQHVGAIAFDPRDSNTVYVAAQGPLWNSGGDRGLYRSTDGGGSWERILEVDEHTGVTAIEVHPDRPDHILAASYQRQRRVWTLIDGGPGSGIHKSTDGGATWRKIGSSLPKGDVGRIGITAAPSNPEMVYAVIEGDAKGQGLYRSTDFGETWEKRTGSGPGFGQYYNRLIVDPKNPERLYSMATFMQVSEDGGKTWNRVGIDHKHVDEHALWIDPTNTDHLITGNDGGIYESFNRGKEWRHIRNLPIAQFYRVSADNDAPFYSVYGGTQDNYSLGAPTRTFKVQGIGNEDWVYTNGGDGFESVIDPTNANIIYAQSQHGGLVRFDKTTGDRVRITPEPGKGESYRWNWNSPIIISPHNNERLYFGSEYLFRSDDQGRSWTRISDDMSRGIDRNTLEVMGRVWSVDSIAKNRSTSIWGSLIGISESTLEEGLIVVGTDDGLIHVTEDGGANWNTIDEMRDRPDIIYVSDTEFSQHQRNRIYATFDNHKTGDFAPYVYRSDDLGRSWDNITGNLPERGFVHTIMEDHVDPDLLFVGTEFGAFFTQNGGESWVQIKGGFPTIAVRDLDIQRRENDLVIGSFGRGIWILDDYSPLRTKAADVTADAASVFPIKDALLFTVDARYGFGPKGFMGEDYYTAKNPAFGAIITYHLTEGLKSLKQVRAATEKEARKDDGDNPYPSWDELRAEDNEEAPAILLTIRDAGGNVVRRITGPSGKGLHRVAWDLRHPANAPISLGSGGGGGFFGPPQGPFVAPGAYSVTVSKRQGGEWSELVGATSFNVVVLDRGLFKADDMGARSAEVKAALDFAGDVSGAGRALGELQSRIDHIRKAVDDTPDASDAQRATIRALNARARDARLMLNGDRTISSRAEQAPASINSRAFSARRAYQSTTVGLSENHRASLAIARAEFEELKVILSEVDAGLDALEGELDGIIPWTPGRLPN